MVSFSFPGPVFVLLMLIPAIIQDRTKVSLYNPSFLRRIDPRVVPFMPVLFDSVVPYTPRPQQNAIVKVPRAGDSFLEWNR